MRAACSPWAGTASTRGLQEAGLLTRPATTDRGRALPAHLTDEGHRRLAAARSAVYTIDQRMTDAVPEERLGQFLADLDRMAAALDG
ncbi:hypothetical protein [Streptomyces sp. NPDC003077]|uniref:hypothetical protein n=1 Tax=Streptomyces sp. NPDC003077 TaxID=3154443 RepID=UPI00339FFD75